MRINRAKFLALVGIVAASTSCSSKKNGSDGTDNTGGTGGEPSTSGNGEAGSGGGGAAAEGTGGGSCLGDMGNVNHKCDYDPSNDNDPGGGQVCGAEDICGVAELSLRQGAAESVDQCLVGLGAKPCAAPRAERVNCLFIALAGACPSPAANATCADIVAACPDVAPEDCAYLNGFNEKGLADMKSCLAEDCTQSIGSCIEGYLGPNNMPGAP